MGSVEVSGMRHTLPGGRVLFSDVSFRVGDGVRAALVGEAAAAGYSTAMRSLAHGRLVIAAMCVGVMARLIDEILGPTDPVTKPDDRAALAEAAVSPDPPAQVGAAPQTPAETISAKAAHPHPDDLLS